MRAMLIYGKGAVSGGSGYVGKKVIILPRIGVGTKEYAK